MKYESLVVEVKKSIGIVWMNRPKSQNRLDEKMISEMTGAMRMLEEDPGVRAVVLAGAGDSFCAGGDLKWMQRMGNASPRQNREDAAAFATLLQTIYTLKKPTIARVHGSAFAGGVGLVAACDIAVASSDAEFRLSEVRLGLIPSTIGPYAVRAMGERAASRYFLTAEIFPAAEAYRTGLLNDITPPEELDFKINFLLGQLIQGGPVAQTLAKDWVHTLADAPMTPDLIKESAERLATMRASDEGREGIAAFIAKRKPAWMGGKKRSATEKPAAPGIKRKKK